MKSFTRTAVFNDRDLQRTGASCYRFITDANRVYDDPNCISMKEDDDDGHGAVNRRSRKFFGEHKRVVIYPCRDGKLLNFVGLYPDCSTGPSKGIIISSIINNNSHHRGYIRNIWLTTCRLEDGIFDRSVSTDIF